MRIAQGTPDYWDLATLLELAILQGDPASARGYADRALAAVRESWEPETTAKNLTYILDARSDRGAEVDWLQAIVTDFRLRADRK